MTLFWNKLRKNFIIKIIQLIKTMEFNKKEKKQLLEWGYPESDIAHIEDAINGGMEFITLFPNGKNKNHITAEGAKKVLGTKEFLSGVGRSAFHSSCIRTNGKKSVYFYYKWWD